MCQVSQHEGGEGEQVESFEGCVEPFVVSGCSLDRKVGSSTHLVKLVPVVTMMAWSLYSGLLEYSKPEQIEAGAAIHLPFDQLESVDLSFNWAIAPRQM